ncbi:MAG: hypothetical protein GC137_01120 [Alphaproteobacteria bacterium]|nr:hypothetical protein [Alphaproteobacteria bacterium]
MSDLFVEVDEALKQERLEKLWKDYGGFVLGIIAALILGTAAKAGYASYVKHENQKQTLIILEQIEDGEYSAEDIASIQSKLKKPLRAIHAFQAAGLFVGEGKLDQAKEQYQKTHEFSKSKMPVLANLAAYMNISYTENTEEKYALLQDIAEDENNLWRYHAYLDLALIEAREKQDYQKARAHLGVILEKETTPETLRQKAQSLDVVYRLKEKIKTQQ